MSSKLRFLGWITSSTKFLNDRIPSWLIVKNWDYGRIMAVGQWSVWLKIRTLGDFHHQHEIPDQRSTIMSNIGNSGLWPDWGVGHRRNLPWHSSSKVSSRWDLSNEPSHVEFEQRELKLYLKNLLFLGKGPGQGQIPGLLGHGSQIPDRTIETHTPTDLCSKFQLSRCYTGWEIAHRRTDDITISVEPIF